MSPDYPTCRFLLLFTLLLFGSVGCKSSRGDPEFNSQFYWKEKSRLAVTASPSLLCETAQNTNAMHRTRCLAVAQLFATYVKPGFDSRQMSKVITDPRWISQCHLALGGVGGGQKPYADLGDESVFDFTLFPDSSGYSDWFMYLVVTPEPREHTWTDAEMIRFLSGTLIDERLRIVEFSICYPVTQGAPVEQGMVTERFTKRGVGLTVDSL